MIKLQQWKFSGMKSKNEWCRAENNSFKCGLNVWRNRRHDHYRQLARRGEELFKNQYFSDSVITGKQPECKTFPVHRNILYASSNSFQTVLDNLCAVHQSHAECAYDYNRLTIEVKDIDPIVLGEIIRFTYTGKFLLMGDLNERRRFILELLQSSSNWKILTLMKPCWMKACAMTCSEWFVDLWNISVELGEGDEFERACVPLLARYIMPIFTDPSNEYCKLTIRQLHKILQRSTVLQFLPAKYVKLILKSLIKWANHISTDERGKQVDKLLKLIDLSNLSDSDLIHFMHDDSPALELKSSKICTIFHNIYQSRLLESKFSETSGFHCFGTSLFSKQMKHTTYHYMKSSWSPLVTLPITITEDMSVAQLGKFIYIIGGGECMSQASTKAFKYNLFKKNDITYIAEMLIPVTKAGAATFNDKIYIIGGVNESKGQLSDVQMYNPMKDTWQVKCSTLVPHVSPNVAYADNSLFVVGSAKSTNVERYCPKLNQWTKITNIPTVPCGTNTLRAISCLDKIYVDRGVFGERAILEYDPVNNLWSSIKNKNIPSDIQGMWSNWNSASKLPFIYVLASGELYSFHPAEPLWTKLTPFLPRLCLYPPHIHTVAIELDGCP